MKTSIHKALEYAYPTSTTATEQGFGKTGCWFVAEYTYLDDKPCEEYSKQVVKAFPGDEDGRVEALRLWKHLAHPVNVWSCQTMRHPLWVEEKRIDGMTFEEYCNDVPRVIADATRDGVKGEAYTYHHMTRGMFNGKTSTRYKPLNNMDLYEYAKRKFGR